MKKRNALALLSALLLLGASVALAVSLACLANLENRQQEAAVRVQILRHHAEETARLGLAHLQASSGPDVAHDFEGPNGLIVVGRFGRADMTGESSEGSLRCSWRVTDLSMAQDASAKAVAAKQASAWARTPAGRAKLPHALAESVSAAERVALAIGDRDLFGQPAKPGTSWQVRGLLTDAAAGGWRKNLSAEAPLTEEVGQPMAAALRSPGFAEAPSRGYPQVRVVDGRRSLDTLPLLTDFRLSMGFFNARSDGRHRLRFHGSMVLWNPLTVPILAGPQGKFFLVEIVGSPEVSVTNLETQSSFVTDLDDCPQEDFGFIRQGLRERGLWFWAEVADPPTGGMAGRGLLPGEVYALVNPSPDTQPQGLARILTRMTWKLDRAYHGPGWKRADPSVLLPGDRIEIAIRFRDKVSIRLRPYAGEPARNEAIADYPAKPAISLEQVSFPDLIIRTTGEDYSREDSSGYVIGERRACLRVKLRPREPGELWAAAAAGAFSRPSWDFRDPEAASEWVADHPVMAALDVVDHDASPLAGPLWDLRANRHEASMSGAFASVRLRDIPGWPWLSVGTLRHLEPPDSKAWMNRLDGCFFGSPLRSAEAGVVSHNPFLADTGIVESIDSPDAARGLMIVGPFNVNSRDPGAWEAFLADNSGAWSPDGGGPFESREVRGPVFFTRPGGASLAKWGALSPVDIEDAAASGLPEPLLTGVAAQQAMRKIPDHKLGQLARKIVELQPSHGWPYASLRAFAESDVLGYAMSEVGIDAPFANVGSPLPVRLRSADLLEAWAPILTVRGDTFLVVGRAEGLGGNCVCEMIVQRVAADHPVARFGRRFRIISARFRNR